MARTDAAQIRPIVPEDPDYWLAAELSPRHVRMEMAGETIATSSRVILFRERGRTPVYYFPRTDVRMDLLTPIDEIVADLTRATPATSTWQPVDGSLRVPHTPTWSRTANG